MANIYDHVISLEIISSDWQLRITKIVILRFEYGVETKKL